LERLAPLHGVAFFYYSQTARLLMREIQVARGLDLKESQVSRLKTFMKEMDEAITALRRKNEISEDPLDKQEERLLSWLPEVLTRKQLTEFRALHCRIEGLAALRHPSYARVLELKQEQKDAIRELIAASWEVAARYQRAIFVSRNDKEASQLWPKLAATARELDTKIFKLLNEKQRKTWIQLLGHQSDQDKRPK
jgi:hypothetical protein